MGARSVRARPGGGRGGSGHGICHTLAAPRPFLEALALVQSRALLLKIPRPIGMRHLLVPGLDLSNHAEQPSALYAFSPTRGGVVRLHATRWLEPGDAVTIRYGDFDNAHFAQQYGFVPASNKLHAVRLPLRCLLPPKADGEASGTATGTEGAEGELEEGGEEAEGEEAEGEEAEGTARGGYASHGEDDDDDDGREEAAPELASRRQSESGEPVPIEEAEHDATLSAPFSSAPMPTAEPGP